MTIDEAKQEQEEMILKIKELKDLILLEEKEIINKNTQSIKKANNKTQRNQIFASQKSVIKNASKLYDKTTDIINAFGKKVT